MREGSTIANGDAVTVSFRDGLAAGLARWSGRPTLVALAVMNAIIGLASVVALAPLSFGRDADTFRRGALSIAEGRMDQDFLYTPLAGLAARPLTWVSPTPAAVVMMLIGIVILAIGVSIETRGQPVVDRVLVAVAAVGFAPVVNEVVLGQVTLLIAAALYVAGRRPDSPANGVMLGIALALAPETAPGASPGVDARVAQARARHDPAHDRRLDSPWVRAHGPRSLRSVALCAFWDRRRGANGQLLPVGGVVSVSLPLRWASLLASR